MMATSSKAASVCHNVKLVPLVSGEIIRFVLYTLIWLEYPCSNTLSNGSFPPRTHVCLTPWLQQKETTNKGWTREIANAQCIWKFSQASIDFFRKSGLCFSGHLDMPWPVDLSIRISNVNVPASHSVLSLWCWSVAACCCQRALKIDRVFCKGAPNSATGLNIVWICILHDHPKVMWYWSGGPANLHTRNWHSRMLHYTFLAHTFSIGQGVASTRGIRGLDFAAGAVFWDISRRVVCTRAYVMCGRRTLEN